MWPILVELDSATSEIRRRKEEEKKEEEEEEEFYTEVEGWLRYTVAKKCCQKLQLPE